MYNLHKQVFATVSNSQFVGAISKLWLSLVIYSVLPEVSAQVGKEVEKVIKPLSEAVNNLTRKVNDQRAEIGQLNTQISELKVENSNLRDKWL